MKTLLLALAVTMSPVAAWAGCANFYEIDPYDLPTVDLCVKDACERTTIIRSCANVHSGFALFSNGWSTHFSVGRDPLWIVIAADGTSVPAIDFDCKPVGEGVEGCF